MASGDALMGSRKRISIKPSRKGALHAALGVPQAQKIPPSKLQQALKSGSPDLKRKAQFASNAKSWG